jgi:S1-C subfamily serine protease
MTKGEISSLRGFMDDTNSWQISVPLQPGNSGGPLFDEAGNVIGIVVSKLDALKIAKQTGDVPQNVNYALKSSIFIPILQKINPDMPQVRKSFFINKKIETVVEEMEGSVVLIVTY